MMDEEWEGYRNFKPRPVLHQKPLRPPTTQYDEPPKSTIRDTPENLELDLPDVLRDDVNAIRHWQIFPWLRYSVKYFRDTLPVIWRIQDIAHLYNRYHKRQVGYDAMVYALKRAGYTPQYHKEESKDDESIQLNLEYSEIRELRSDFNIKKIESITWPTTFEMSLKTDS
jgi:hypothetical protein